MKQRTSLTLRQKQLLASNNKDDFFTVFNEVHNSHLLSTSVGHVTIKTTNDESERLAAIISLGVIGDIKYKDILINMLDYEEPNIRWDSAIALAKMGNDSGAFIIENLLNREYLRFDID